MARRKAVEETTEEVEVIKYPCVFCAQTGQLHIGWDENGEDIFQACEECGGDGYK